MKVRGTRDFLPEEEIARREVLRTIEETFVLHGFSPVDTPALETAEVLTKKGGEGIEEEIYLFEDKGGRKIGLRFDHTVPLARLMAENPVMQLPFRRYAIGKVWRYDRPQAGRYREFTQADVDIVGADSVTADVECVLAGVDALKAVGTPPFVVKVNSRKLVWEVCKKVGMKEEEIPEFVRTVDKWDKVGEEGVREELKKKGMDGYLDDYLDRAENAESDDVNEFLEIAGEVGIPAEFDFRLVRGLDYYTGLVFEAVVRDYPSFGTVAGGGRYDSLIGMLIGKQIPATGFSIGVDRLFALLEEAGAVRKRKTVAEAFVAVVGNTAREAMRVAQMLRSNGIPTEVEVMGRKLGKQMEYAGKKGVPVVVIAGERDVREGMVTVRDMESGEEKRVGMEDVVRVVRGFLSSSGK